MNICILSKYPPIEGGVASTTYWFAKALGERGHKIHIVTNARKVEKGYKEVISDNELHFLEPKNVKLHNLENKFISPILRSHYYTDRLAGLTLDIIKTYNIDIVYSFYLLPYGVVGMITKLLTGKPFIVRNAGSDIGRLYLYPSLKPLLKEVLQKADWIHGAGGILKVLDECGISHEKIIRFGHGTIDTEAFNPKVKPYNFSTLVNKNLNDTTVLTFIGKIQPTKRIDNLINALSMIKDEDFLMVFVSGEDYEVKRIKRLAEEKKIKDKCVFMPFQPPWKIPSIMTASRCIILPETSEIPMLPEGVHYPIIGREALACRRCVMLGEGIAKRGYYKKLEENINVLIINPVNIKDFSEKLRFVIKNADKCDEIGKNAYKFSKEVERPEEYFDKVSLFFENIKIHRKL